MERERGRESERLITDGYLNLSHFMIGSRQMGNSITHPTNTPLFTLFNGYIYALAYLCNGSRCFTSSVLFDEKRVVLQEAGIVYSQST